jgi:hypothetical protein
VFRYHRWFFHMLLFQLLKFIFCVFPFSVETYPVFPTFSCVNLTVLFVTLKNLYLFDVFVCYQHLIVLVFVPE